MTVRLTDVWALLNAGKTKAEAARILGTSRQRIQQLVGREGANGHTLTREQARAMGIASGRARRKKAE